MYARTAGLKLHQLGFPMTEARTTEDTCEAAAAVSDADEAFLLDECGRPLLDESGRPLIIELDEQSRFLTEKM
jgi:hypothetical protein